jgi:hypothetical protein
MNACFTWQFESLIGVSLIKSARVFVLVLVAQRVTRRHPGMRVITGTGSDSALYILPVMRCAVEL